MHRHTPNKISKAPAFTASFIEPLNIIRVSAYSTHGYHAAEWTALGNRTSSVTLKLTDITSVAKTTALVLLLTRRSHIKSPNANMEIPRTVNNWWSAGL